VKTKTCHSSWRSFLLQYVADYAAGIKCQSVRCRLPNCIMTLINLPSNPREKRFAAEFSAALQLQLLHVDTLVCLPVDGNRLTQISLGIEYRSSIKVLYSLYSSNVKGYFFNKTHYLKEKE